MATGPMSFEKRGLTPAEANAVVGNGYCREPGQAHRARNCVNDLCKIQGHCIRKLQCYDCAHFGNKENCSVETCTNHKTIAQQLHGAAKELVRQFETTPVLPDANCVTRADGACISEVACMHSEISQAVNAHTFADHDALAQAMRCKHCNPVVEIVERKEENRSAWLKQEQVSGDESVAAIADKLVNTDRQSTYGHPFDNHERICNLWNAYIEGRRHGGPLTPQDACILMILLKVARLENGYHRDSVIDICGYGKCLDMVEAESKRRDA